MNPTYVQHPRADVRCSPGSLVEMERLRFVQAILLEQSTALAACEAMPVAQREEAHCLLHDHSALAWPIGWAPLFADTIVRSGDLTDWMILNLSEDPLWTSTSRFLIPGKVLRHLKRLCRAGVEFDTLVIAHEVRHGLCRQGEGVPLESVLPPPPHRAVRIARWAGRFSRFVWFAAGLPVLGAAMPLITAAGALDPILLGARVRPGARIRPGELACWYYLCHWTW